MNNNSKKSLECRICQNKAYTETVSIHNMPLLAQNLPDTDTLSSDYGISLNVYACPYCGVVFLDSEPVDYYREVIRAVAVSSELREEKLCQLKEYCSKYDLADKAVIEIGSGNGEYLDILTKCTSSAFGIEYAKDAVLKCRDKGFNVLEGFISDENYKICDFKFSGFLLLMFLEHIPNPRSFLKGIYNNLTDDAVGIIEVPNADMIFSKGLYAEIMRDHLYYFTSHSLTLLLNSCGFEVIEKNEIRDGYVLSFIVRKMKIQKLCGITEYIEEIKASFQTVLKRYDEIAIWGASHQTFFLLSQIGDTSKINCIIDSAKFKQNRYSPVTHVPIYPPTNSILSLSAIIVSAGSYSEEIVNILHSTYRFSGDIYVFDTNKLIMR